VIKIIITEDGSHSLLNTELDETYHSKHGAVQESMHVFIRNGLEFFAKKSSKRPINILEVGFGTGLNALLSVHSNIPVNYTAVEPHPLDEEIIRSLNYTPRALLEQLHQKSEVTIQNLQLKKIYSPLQALTLDSVYDIIYFDAFAPSKQPDMWEFPVIEKVCNALTEGGIFVTYCAKGQLKRDLKSLGMEVETLPGPPGKKEMVRGLKLLAASF
jgi:tRNA U34 5-methylaminomethyl-2-thiouridine-forming methyltransferase MnmC